MAGSDGLACSVRRASACASPAAASSGLEAPSELRRVTRSSAAASGCVRSLARRLALLR